MQISKFVSFGIASAVLALGFSGTAARAETFLNINFDDQNNGESVLTDTATTLPITHVYSHDGFPDVPPFSGTAVVGSPAPLSKAAVLSTTQGGIGAQFLDTQFIKIADRITLDFDLNVLDVPTSGLPQDGQAFVIQAFNATTSDRVWRFIVSPTSATTGSFGMRNNTDGSPIPFGTYNEGETNHLSIAADYTTNQVSVSLNGVPSLTVPFVVAGTPTSGMAEFFIFQNGVEGQLNQVAIDNLLATAVPEPASISLLVCGAIGMLGMYARCRRK